MNHACSFSVSFGWLFVHLTFLSHAFSFLFSLQVRKKADQIIMCRYRLSQWFTSKFLHMQLDILFVTLLVRFLIVVKMAILKKFQAQMCLELFGLPRFTPAADALSHLFSSVTKADFGSLEPLQLKWLLVCPLFLTFNFSSFIWRANGTLPQNLFMSYLERMVTWFLSEAWVNARTWIPYSIA